MRKTPFLLILIFFSFDPPAISQTLIENNNPPNKLRVFIDGCNRRDGGCDMDFIRTEITAVDFYRDNQLADVFVLINDNESGGGGRQYQLIFIGQQNIHAGRTDTLYVNNKQTDTDFEVREKLTRFIKLGLAPFVAKTKAGEVVEINMKTELSVLEDTARETVDPWNYWVFNVGSDANIELEELSKQINFGGDINIDRITDKWKISLSGRIDERLRRTIQKEPRVDDNGNPVLDENGNQIIDEVENKFDVSEFGFSHQLVKAISPKWSYGYDIAGRQNTRFNYKFQTSFRPAVEYNFFPESVQNSRFLRVNYGVEVRNNRYVEETIYGAVQETRVLHSLRASLGLNQRWGNLEVGYRLRNYLDDFSSWSTGLNISAEVRVTGNFSFFMRVEGNYVKDQIYLASGDFTEQDILSGRVTLPSAYNVDSRFGFNYRFGSNLNNFVNRRFFGRANFVGND
ncbi:hypothetical protein [Algoriphagus machipongonensis]|uniref:DUF481 domain-containing protein n=1 Tax=Algoriphagus machipongonensis TaxID=388413 RepID=A3I2K4_9BACT|nr:hypothetical protein [Algoriphagus machipongonensis]EAZ79308.1 hypothetical protein ALPR1_16708 [Algoriphagus machipongonensis]